MKLILIRHGHDLPSPGAENGLSKQGRAQIQTTADRLARAGFERIDVGFHSPALRAEQTLAELANVVSFKSHGECDYLLPESPAADIDLLLWELWASSRPDVVLFAGHEPQLSNSILSFCGLPENDPQNKGKPSWVMTRGEAIALDVSFEGDRISVDFETSTQFGKPRALPGAPAKPTRVFG